MIKKQKSTLYLLLVGTLLFGGANQVSSWTAPGGSAPTVNSEPPINKSEVAQKKKGDFGVSALASYGQAIFTGKIKIADGSQNHGKILVSDNAGNTTWAYPPEYAAEGTGVCPPGTSVMSSTGECGYQYELRTGATTYCYGSDQRISYYDAGIGRNHGVAPLAPNGCYAWEGRRNNGNQQCVMQCLGAVTMCYTQAGGGQWYLSNTDRKCTR